MEKNFTILEALGIGVAVACASVIITSLLRLNSLLLGIVAFPVCTTGALLGMYFTGIRAGSWLGAVTGAILALLLSFLFYYFTVYWLIGGA